MSGWRYSVAWWLLRVDGRRVQYRSVKVVEARVGGGTNGLPQERGEYVDEHTPVFHWSDSFRCGMSGYERGCGCLWRRLDGHGGGFGGHSRCNEKPTIKYINPRLKCARASCEECNGELPKFRASKVVADMAPRPIGPWRSNMPEEWRPSSDGEQGGQGATRA